MMKRWVAVGIAVLMLMTARVMQAEAVTAQAAVVMEQSTGRVLMEKNADAVLPMASTTKIMTAMVVLEEAEPDEIVVIEKEMTGIEGSSMYLEEGEELTVEQLLYGLMLRSGNDAAVALAMHVGGSVEGFAEKMNEKAAELGLKDTHFVNPHGLPAEGHHTTARELAKITCAAYENEEFRRIAATQKMVVPWKGHEFDRAMQNKNKILTLYEGGNGVKTGYTKAAGRCLVAGAEREGMQLICVALNAPQMWEDCMAMMDKGFEEYDMVPVIEEGDRVGEVGFAFGGESVGAVAAETVALPLKEGEEAEIVFHLPEKMEVGVAQGEQIGYAIIEEMGIEPVHVELVADEDVQMPKKARYGEAVRRVMGLWFMAAAAATAAE